MAMICQNNNQIYWRTAENIHIAMIVVFEHKNLANGIHVRYSPVIADKRPPEKQ